MPSYRLTPEAEADIENIFEYGIDSYGIEPAVKYLDKLKKRLADIAKSPLMFPAVDHIREGYRRSVCGVHSIYYRIDGDAIDIMRILYREGMSQNLAD